MKKFIVRDEDNKEFEVEEIEEVKDDIDETPAENEPASLSEDEIGALKKIASVADKLVALIDIEKDEHAGEPASEMLDEDEDEDTDPETEEDREEIVDTDEELDKSMLRKDSKKSVGAIERHKNSDSIHDSQELDVAQAWAKRYGGKK